MKNRLTAMLLALLLLSSCSESIPETETQTGNETAVQEAAVQETTGSENAAAEEEDLRKNIKDDLPEISFEGDEYRVLTKEGTQDEFYVEEIIGEATNDAVFERNNVIQERFDVKIVPILTTGSGMYDQINDIKKRVTSQDDSFDIAGTYVMTAGSPITSGYFIDWNSMQYNDFSKPWWLNSVNDNFSVNNRLYTVTGEACTSLLKLTYAVFFNRTQGDNYGLTDTVFEKVKEGTWTIDYLNETVGNIYEDLNGNGIKDSEDFLGFTGEDATNLMMYTYAFDIPLTLRNAEGIPEISVNSEKTVTAVEIVTDLYWNNPGSLILYYTDARDLFASGHAMFNTNVFSYAFSEFREMEDDYTILPYPKFDESQEKYLTSAMDNFTVLCIPVTCQKLDMVSIITESLNVESFRSVYPVYYEIALKDKYARDAFSIEMIDLLMEGRTFDFAILFTGTDSLNLNSIFKKAVLTKNGDFASVYAREQRRMEKLMGKIIDAFSELPE